MLIICRCGGWCCCISVDDFFLEYFEVSHSKHTAFRTHPQNLAIINWKQLLSILAVQFYTFYFFFSTILLLFYYVLNRKFSLVCLNKIPSRFEIPKTKRQFHKYIYSYYQISLITFNLIFIKRDEIFSYFILNLTYSSLLSFYTPKYRNLWPLFSIV